MLRSILAVIVTYVLMAVVVMAAFMGLWFGLGPDGLLQPGSFKGNTLITIAAPAITVVGGLFGGGLCARLGKKRGPVMVLAGLMMDVGLMTAYLTLQKPFSANPRPLGMRVQGIMEVGREPTWVVVSKPILGAGGGVPVGGLAMGCACCCKQQA